jgi:hypothetical protein
MRRRVCVMVLLFGLAGQGYVSAARVPEPVPIERPIGAIRGGRLRRTAAWWQAS